MHFVYNIHLISSHRGRKDYILPQRAYLVHAVVAGRVHLYYIHSLPPEGGAKLAFSASVSILRLRAVYGARKNFGQAGLARAPRAGKKISVRYMARGYLRLKSAHNNLLPHYVPEKFGPPFSIKRLIAHLLLLQLIIRLPAEYISL